MRLREIKLVVVVVVVVAIVASHSIKCQQSSSISDRVFQCRWYMHIGQVFSGIHSNDGGISLKGQLYAGQTFVRHHIYIDQGSNEY